MGIFDRIAGTLDDLVSGTESLPEDDLNSQIVLIRGLLARGETAEGTERLSDLLRRFPRATEVHELRGEQLCLAGDVEGAMAAFGRAVDLDPTRAGTWVWLGETLTQLRRAEPARDALRRALAFGTLSATERARALQSVGRVYTQLGQHTKAVRELRKLVELSPGEPASLAALGRALLASGDREGAEWLVSAARLPESDPEWFVEAATAMQIEPTALTASADPADAPLRLLGEAIERAPQNIRIRVAWTRRLASLGLWADAAAAARNAIVLHPDDRDLWSLAEEVYAGAGQYDDAIAAARRVRELGGDSGDFRLGLPLALGARDLDFLRQLLHDQEIRTRATNETQAQGQTANKQDARPSHLFSPWPDLHLSDVQAFVNGHADPGALLRLARVAPNEPARRFVLSAGAPPPIPEGNVFGLLTWTRDFVAGRPGLTQVLSSSHSPLLSLALPLSRAIEAFDRPLLVAVMGEFNAGKSSFVNALAGDSIARVGVTPTTATINILRYGTAGGGRVHFLDGTIQDLAAGVVGSFLEQLDDGQAARVRWVEIFSPAEALRRFEIVDTPGLNALRPEHERVAHEFLVEADAVVWVFALGQAAKASERQALDLVHAAGKQVLGVINKVDGADPDDVQAVMAHVSRELGSHLAGLVPFSARAALRAQQEGVDPQTPDASGRVAVESALEHLFFDHARQLKQATALASLRRFADDAQTVADKTQTHFDEYQANLVAERQALSRVQAALRSTAAAERVALRARIDRAMRTAALDVREFVRPRAWPFGEARVEAASETDLSDLLDDAVSAAVQTAATALQAALSSASDGLSDPLREDLRLAIHTVVTGFEAYARGSLEGSATLFFRVDLARARGELPALANLLATYAPDPDIRLFREWERQIDARTAHAHRELNARADALTLERLAFEEQLALPLSALRTVLERSVHPNQPPEPVPHDTH